MPNPKIDEDGIVQMLDAISSPMSAQRLQQGAFYACMAGFDRKIVREPYADLLGEVCALHDLMGRLTLAQGFLDRMNEKKLSLPMVEKAIKGLTLKAEIVREKLLANMKLVAQCPFDEDTRH